MARKSAAQKRQRQKAREEAEAKAEADVQEEDDARQEARDDALAAHIAAMADDEDDIGQSGDDASEELGNSDDGEDEEEDDVEERPVSAKNTKTNKGRRAALPSLQEQEYLRETKTLFQSNLLRLQMGELLEQSRVTASAERAEKERAFLFALKDAVMKAKHKGIVTEAVLGVPLENWETEKPVELEAFAAPEAVDVVGSYLLGTVTKPSRTVDLAIRMPADCFKRKDYLNHRYLDKRRLYLGVLAKSLAKKKDLVAATQFAPFTSDLDKPVLLVTPSAEANVGKMLVRILPVISEDVFPISRFQLDQNNVRPLNRFEPEAGSGEGQARAGLTPAPTPHYNMRVLEDIESSGPRSHLELFHEVKESCQSFAPVSCLLKIWARVRGFSSSDGPDNFSEFLLTAFLAHQLLEKRISSMLSVQQLFRNFMGVIAKTDLGRGPVARLRPSTGGNPVIHNGLSDEEVRKAFDVALMGPCGRLNLAWRVSASAWAAVVEQAKLTYDLLEGSAGQSGGRSAFESIFSAPVHLWHQFDKYYSIAVPSKDPVRWQTAGLERSEQALLCDLGWEAYVQRCVEHSFRRGFLDTHRAHVVRVRVNAKECASWDPKETPQRTALLVCMQLDREEAFRVIDKGPNADHVAATAAFRAFWGSKSELRRFRDGSILETLDWRPEHEKSNKRPASGAPTSLRDIDVCDKIADFVARRRWPLEKGATVVGRELEVMLGTLDRQDRQRARQLSVPDVPFPALRTCVEDLMSRLRGLSLPLAVTGFRVADPSLRYSSVTLPGQHPLAFGAQETEGAAVLSSIMGSGNAEGGDRKKRKVWGSSKGEKSTTSISRLVDVVDLVVELESSGQWPDDVEAIRVMKTAFYVQIAEQLEASHPGQQRCEPSRTCLDVLTGGYGFRLRIRLDKERQLLRSPRVSFTGSASTVAARRIRAERGEDGDRLVRDEGIPTQLALQQASALERDTVDKPHLHAMLHSIHGRGDDRGGANVMGPVSRLAKLWMSGHLFWSHVSEEAIELIVASLFLHPQPYKAPRSLMSGFVRFLQLLSTWDWEFEPLLIDLSDADGVVREGAATSEIDLRTSLMKSFTAARERASGASMFIVTNEDRDAAGEWTPKWTDRSHPSPRVLSRVTTVAKDSLVLLEQLFALQASGRYDAGSMQRLWGAVFKSSVSPKDFDVVIKLNPVSSLREARLPMHARAKLYKNTASQERLLLGCNPMSSFASDLVSDLGHLFSVQCDPFRGQAIGLRWNADIHKPVALRVAATSHAKPAKNDSAEAAEGEVKLVPNVTDILVDIASLGEGIIEQILCSPTSLEQ
ncbi:Nucleolar protein 6 [Hondaea fermentalgiana]|uniref:Nucleolar protein 6 n=1 Tax=Hondaea fermentalgiana TaxID=2315210 RepID=A0A2R5G2X0_9STRA|nr:Nucleolar protein 6 [Hondaea fermentalgiana]|eukprot:GBG25377.1 Nucleolar protein 6 [Hondaea fermentalgiana]